MKLTKMPENIVEWKEADASRVTQLKGTEAAVFTLTVFSKWETNQMERIMKKILL